MGGSSLSLKLHLLQVLTALLLLNSCQPVDVARQFGRFVGVEDGKVYQSFLYDLLSQEPEDENLRHPVRNTVDGDLILTPEQKEQFFQDNKPLQAKRKILSRDYMLWPKGIVLWTFAKGKRQFKRSTSYKRVLQAIQQWEKYTCLKFVKRGSKEHRRAKVRHRAMVVFGTGKGCASPVGYTYGVLNVYLNEKYCMRQGTIIHEIGHAIGFFHEQARSDRDDHVKIIKENVKDGKMKNFVIIRGLANKASYDLGSIMHYGRKYFSKNGKNTISPKNPMLAFLMGQRQRLSFYDLQEVNHGYKCAAKCTNAPKCENGGFLLKSCQCHCPSGLVGSRCQNINSRHSKEEIFNLTFGGSRLMKSPRHHKHTTGVWVVKSPKGTTMKIHLILDLSYDRGLRLCNHWLEVRFNLIGQPAPRFCGRSMKPLKLNSTSNMVMLKFDSRARYYRAKRGFLLHVAVQPINTSVICTFKGTGDDTCPFYQSKDDDIDWETFTMGHVTPRQHDEDSVSYIFIDSGHDPQGGTAVLRSAEILEGSWCLKFLYFLNGAESLGHMYVVAMTTKRTGRWYLWGTSKGSESDWSAVKLTVTSKDNFLIQFVGVVKEHLTICVSMIELVPKPCERPTKTVNLVHKKDLKVAFTCDFDDDWCGFTEGNDITPMWSRRQSFSYVGPSRDHKQKGHDRGFYMSRKSPYQTKRAGRLVSPTLTAAKHYGCVRFWIYVWGFSPGSMIVYLQDGRGSRTVVWKSVYRSPNFSEWSQITVPIKLASKTYKIIFEMKVTYRWGNIALDDVTVLDSHC